MMASPIHLLGIFVVGLAIGLYMSRLLKKEGFENYGDAEPTWFYRKGEERYLTERPEPEIYWSAVTPGTVCFVANNSNEMELERIFLCFLDGEKWFGNSGTKSATTWRHARLKP